MKNVKRIFFLTTEEAKKVGPYVVSDMPHYELEDGTIRYTCAGGPAEIEHWTATSGEYSDRDRDLDHE